MQLRQIGREHFGRKLKEDARPMLILAPMHPVLTVYELDQTEGPRIAEGARPVCKV